MKRRAGNAASQVIGLVLLLAAGCQRGAPSTPDAGAPRLIEVTAERSDLLFRFRDAEGEVQSATRLADVPEAARAAVQVMDLSLSPAERSASKVVQVFDLRQPGPDGRFTGTLVPRDGLERALAAAQATAPAPSIIMYSAAWCGVCSKARRFLNENNIPFVEKDIDKDRSAAGELRKKAAAAGVDASGVPVFDIGGRLMSGFDGNALLAATGRTPK